MADDVQAPGKPSAPAAPAPAAPAPAAPAPAAPVAVTAAAGIAQATPWGAILGFVGNVVGAGAGLYQSKLESDAAGDRLDKALKSRGWLLRRQRSEFRQSLVQSQMAMASASRSRTGASFRRVGVARYAVLAGVALTIAAGAVLAWRVSR